MVAVLTLPTKTLVLFVETNDVLLVLHMTLGVDGIGRKVMDCAKAVTSLEARVSESNDA